MDEKVQWIEDLMKRVPKGWRVLKDGETLRAGDRGWSQYVIDHPQTDGELSWWGIMSGDIGRVADASTVYIRRADRYCCGCGQLVSGRCCGTIAEYVDGGL